ncbi:MAG: phosphoketolase family protein [Bacilli bacterium]|nr:phosphoketolase family protein [Bacilli bacterium]
MALTKKELENMNAYFRALNYLSVAQLYLLDNPLLKRKLSINDIKPNVVGHWGTAPGQNFIYMHLNRIIKKFDLKMIYLSGPGHGGQAMVANNYLEGVYTKYYPEITQNELGLKKLCKQFSFPGGISSHVAPETPGSIHEGGELGYSLAHAAGAVLDNKDLIAACVVGDGEAETGPLATSWHINKFLNKKTDGTVLPILHRNGYKIANPTIFGRMSDEEIEDFFYGYGWKPYFVEGKSPTKLHDDMARTLDKAIRDIKKVKEKGTGRYPVIVLTTPKGWTGPKEVDNKKMEGSFRAHQVPIPITKDHPENLPLLEKWLKSYHPEELFDEEGKLKKELKELCPPLSKCMGNSPYANGGLLLKDIIVPKWENYTLDIKHPGEKVAQDTIELGNYIRDVFLLNKNHKNFRYFGPDEAMSNRLNNSFKYENRTWNYKKLKGDDHLSKNGRIMDSYLSEHLCQGMLEGYLLTGRHGFIHSYEAFTRIVDSMASQHAKWLKVSNDLPWRAPIASLNYLLVSHVFQQDHNGYTHQDPGFLNHVATKKADVVRLYLPPDTNCLLSCFDHCIRTKNYLNVIVASKHPRPQWLTRAQAKLHCTKGLSIWDFASNDNGNPDVIMACAGETPTLETLAAVSILRKSVKGIRIRVVNVVDLMKLQSNETHPHGMRDEEYDAIFTKDKPIIFNFHGYPSLIHQLTYKRTNRNIHVHGYKEEGTITTTFDIRVQNEIDRFNLVKSALKEIPRYRRTSQVLMDWCDDMLKQHKAYIHEYGEDMPFIKNWKWED